MYNSILPIYIQSCITEFISREIEVCGNEYNPNEIWIADQKCGGIGAYCLPANPIKNPFPGGEQRELFRPLQYARAGIDVSDINLHARTVVHVSGMHLEAVCRLVVKKCNKFKVSSFSNTTLGKAVRIIAKYDKFDRIMIDALFDFVSVYNRSKHDINQEENRERLFNAKDAITAYFSARILGLNLLKHVGYSEATVFYEINNE